jgi:hypothetical protein
MRAFATDDDDESQKVPVDARTFIPPTGPFAAVNIHGQHILIRRSRPVLEVGAGGIVQAESEAGVGAHVAAKALAVDVHFRGVENTLKTEPNGTSLPLSGQVEVLAVVSILAR